MFELVKAGGWLMLPIIACSIVALAIIVERIWSLQMRRVLPKHLVAQVWRWEKVHQLNGENLRDMQGSSPLGSILAAGILKRYKTRDVMKESIEDTGRHVVHELERYLNTLGTIAAITPLLGLLGTVIGMITTFQAITLFGAGDPKTMAGGISQALVTTVLGLVVAIPTTLLHSIVASRSRSLIHVIEEQSAGIIAEHAEKSGRALG